eukprot:CAMPEP_0206016454 /NCGR_PEP_ID=MMETSP1464-20131121/22833_1 /ASSEMBLY_ACC=CAM_ASM_001124 /TAXON_ID=119497 /ORGANISM="Exanthemachrysis gayraliae, Strain RCC1523" /LENGTH=130 /DNA_ID=CAMNT_0053390269 /DNA_START=45 /DNA_END=435 /DNA_ORIENTATION=+
MTPKAASDDVAATRGSGVAAISRPAAPPVGPETGEAPARGTSSGRPADSKSHASFLWPIYVVQVNRLPDRRHCTDLGTGVSAARCGGGRQALPAKRCAWAGLKNGPKRYITQEIGFCLVRAVSSHAGSHT